MAVTNSTMLELGTRAPAFALRDTAGKVWSLDDFPQPNPVLVMFICNHCPFVKHVQHELAQLARDYQARGVAMVGDQHATTSTRYPDDSPEKMKAERERVGYSFPYLYRRDPGGGEGVSARRARPTSILFDGERRLVYRGQLDDSRPGNEQAGHGRGPARGARQRCSPGKRPWPTRSRASAATSSGVRGTSRPTSACRRHHPRSAHRDQVRAKVPPRALPRRASPSPPPSSGARDIHARAAHVDSRWAYRAHQGSPARFELVLERDRARRHPARFEGRLRHWDGRGLGNPREPGRRRDMWEHL